MKPDTDIHMLPPQVAHGLILVVPGALVHFLTAEEPPGSFLLRVRAHGMADHVARPCVLGRGHRLDAEGAVALRELRVLVQGRRLDAEVAEAIRELRRPWPEVGEATRGMVQESPQRH